MEMERENLDKNQPGDGILGSPYASGRLETNPEACCLLVLPAKHNSFHFIPVFLLVFG